MCDLNPGNHHYSPPVMMNKTRLRGTPSQIAVHQVNQVPALLTLYLTVKLNGNDNVLKLNNKMNPGILRPNISTTARPKHYCAQFRSVCPIVMNMFINGAMPWLL